MPQKTKYLDDRTFYVECERVTHDYFFYHKTIFEGSFFRDECLAVKTGSLHLDSNQGRLIAGLMLYQLSYRVRQVFTAKLVIP